MGRCTSRGCLYSCSVRSGRRGTCGLGYGIDDDYYRGRGGLRRGCLGPRGRIDAIEAYGTCCSCHGCRPNTSMNAFEQYDLNFDQLFVGWNQNCPCRCGGQRRNINTY